MIWRKYILLVIIGISFAKLEGQDYKCLYHSMWPVLNMKAQSNNDYLLEFYWEQDSLMNFEVQRVFSTAACDDSLQILDIYERLHKVLSKDISFCFEDTVVARKISYLLSTRTYVPYYGERNVSLRIEKFLKNESKRNETVFVNLGIVYYHDPKKE